VVVIESLNKLIVAIGIKYMNQTVAAGSGQQTKTRQWVGKVEARHIGLMRFDENNLFEAFSLVDPNVAKAVTTSKLAAIVGVLDTAKTSLATSFKLRKLSFSHPIVAVLRGDDAVKLSSKSNFSCTTSNK
jgi:hypothetical protein